MGFGEEAGLAQGLAANEAVGLALGLEKEVADLAPGLEKEVVGLELGLEKEAVGLAPGSEKEVVGLVEEAGSMLENQGVATHLKESVIVEAAAAWAEGLVMVKGLLVEVAAWAEGLVGAEAAAWAAGLVRAEAAAWAAGLVWADMAAQVATGWEEQKWVTAHLEDADVEDSAVLWMQYSDSVGLVSREPAGSAWGVEEPADWALGVEEPADWALEVEEPADWVLEAEDWASGAEEAVDWALEAGVVADWVKGAEESMAEDLAERGEGGSAVASTEISRYRSIPTHCYSSRSPLEMRRRR